MENSKQQQAVRVGNSYWIKVVAIFFHRLDSHVCNTNHFQSDHGSGW